MLFTKHVDRNEVKGTDQIRSKAGTFAQALRFFPFPVYRRDQLQAC
jgi:hypothetical protein